VKWTLCFLSNSELKDSQLSSNFKIFGKHIGVDFVCHWTWGSNSLVHFGNASGTRPVGNSSHFVRKLSFHVWRSPGEYNFNFKIAVTKKIIFKKKPRLIIDCYDIDCHWLWLSYFDIFWLCTGECLNSHGSMDGVFTSHRSSEAKKSPLGYEGIASVVTSRMFDIYETS